jgi:hypothetical protein
VAYPFGGSCPTTWRACAPGARPTGRGTARRAGRSSRGQAAERGRVAQRERRAALAPLRSRRRGSQSRRGRARGSPLSRSARDPSPRVFRSSESASASSTELARRGCAFEQVATLDRAREAAVMRPFDDTNACSHTTLAGSLTPWRVSTRWAGESGPALENGAGRQHRTSTCYLPRRSPQLEPARDLGTDRSPNRWALVRISKQAPERASTGLFLHEFVECGCLCCQCWNKSVRRLRSRGNERLVPLLEELRFREHMADRHVKDLNGDVCARKRVHEALQ